MTLAVLADQLAGFCDGLPDAILPKAGPALRRVALDHARRATGGRMMDRTLDADTKLRGDSLAVFPTPAGPWTLLEAGSRKRQWWEPAHVSPRSRRIRIGRDVRVRVLHGPIRGKRIWTAARREMGDVWSDVAHTEARKLWGRVDGT